MNFYNEMGKVNFFLFSRKRPPWLIGLITANGCFVHTLELLSASDTELIQTVSDLTNLQLLYQHFATYGGEVV